MTIITIGLQSLVKAYAIIIRLSFNGFHNVIALIILQCFYVMQFFKYGQTSYHYVFFIIFEPH